VDAVLLLKALILGVIEGLTEFLPISSTGHLILGEALLNFNDGKGQIFEIVIQSGAIFAVCWEYRQRIATVCGGLRSDPAARQFALNIAVAFVPLAVLGLLFQKNIKAVLFAPIPVALAFIIGGCIILWVERHNRMAAKPARVTEVEQMGLADAIKLGIAQAFALIPGTSRSGATIIGGMLFGLSRKAATEFSFFLAIPTLLIASAYELFKARALLSIDDLPVFATGLVAAFVSAFLCVRWLLRYISSHDFSVFAWYRIAFGLLVLLSSHFHWVDWHG
jgi:undecaprenyl-diphosphatase